MGHFLRGGFHMEGDYRGHRNDIINVEFDEKTKTYVSLDCKCVKLWRSTGEVRGKNSVEGVSDYVAGGPPLPPLPPPSLSSPGALLPLAPLPPPALAHSSRRHPSLPPLCARARRRSWRPLTSPAPTRGTLRPSSTCRSTTYSSPQPWTTR